MLLNLSWHHSHIFPAIKRQMLRMLVYAYVYLQRYFSNGKLRPFGIHLNYPICIRLHVWMPIYWRRFFLFARCVCVCGRWTLLYTIQLYVLSFQLIWTDTFPFCILSRQSHSWQPIRKSIDKKITEKRGCSYFPSVERINASLLFFFINCSIVSHHKSVHSDGEMHNAPAFVLSH